MDQIDLALDWTPNINHIGFFVAEDLGFYEEENLNVFISEPAQDDYTTTPAKKVELGIADFALCPTESILSYRTKTNPFKLIAVAAVLQQDLSSIAVLDSSGINSPRELDGKTYASYQARYEDQIVKEMIRKDGGAGNIAVHYPAKLGIWETLLKGDFDATWIFANWEGVEAEGKGIQLKQFRLEDYSIPYSYSPLIATDEASLRNRKSEYRRFMNASRKGYMHGLKFPEEALACLKRRLPKADSQLDVKKCLDLSKEAFGTQETWGKMDLEKVDQFLNWVYDHKLETDRHRAQDLFTNELL